MKTVGNVVGLIMRNAHSDNPDLRSHAMTLLEPRTRGSWTEKGLEDIDSSIPLMLVTEQISESMRMAGCQYYTFYCPLLKGKVGAIAYEEAIAVHGVDAIKRRDGVHGPELFLDRDKVECDDVWSDWITVIVGDFKGEKAVYSWYPGGVLGVLKGEPKADTAVKLHRG